MAKPTNDTKRRDRREYYQPHEVEAIRSAYKRLFPELTPALREYWNFEHAPRTGSAHRPHYPATRQLWPYLTTDFHSVTYAQLEAVSDAASDIDQRTLAHWDRGSQLAAACRPGVGLSIGISPWTDHALFASRAWEEQRDRLVIVLGHDWYPIATDNDKYFDSCHPCDVPLAKYRALDDPDLGPGYQRAIPAAVKRPDERTAVLFMNLVPDLRAPAFRKKGPLWGYTEWARGFDAAMESVLRTFDPDKVTVLAWGAETWKALLPRLSAGHGFGIKEWQRRASGEYLHYRTGRGEVRLLPSAHPSYPGNLDRNHLGAGFANLQLA